MSLSSDLRSRYVSLWKRKINHPFVLGIGDGTLDMDRFKYYMCQDYLFLIDYSRVSALAVAKAERVEDMAWFARQLHGTLNGEMGLHESFCGEFGISPEELRATKASPTTLAYTDHLIRVAYSGGVGEIATAMLPCSWGYAEIGRTLSDRGLPEDRPLHSKWIETYASEEYMELNEQLRAFVDRAGVDASAESLRRMEAIFALSSQHEYRFWEAAYRMEGRFI